MSKLNNPHVFIDFMPTSFRRDCSLYYLAAARFELNSGGKVDEDIFRGCVEYDPSQGTISREVLDMIAANGYPDEPKPLKRILEDFHNWNIDGWDTCEVWCRAPVFFFPMMEALVGMTTQVMSIQPDRLHSMDTLAVLQPNDGWHQFKTDTHNLTPEALFEQVSFVQSVMPQLH